MNKTVVAIMLCVSLMMAGLIYLQVRSFELHSFHEPTTLGVKSSGTLSVMDEHGNTSVYYQVIISSGRAPLNETEIVIIRGGVFLLRLDLSNPRQYASAVLDRDAGYSNDDLTGPIHVMDNFNAGYFSQGDYICIRQHNADRPEIIGAVTGDQMQIVVDGNIAAKVEISYNLGRVNHLHMTRAGTVNVTDEYGDTAEFYLMNIATSLGTAHLKDVVIEIRIDRVAIHMLDVGRSNITTTGDPTAYPNNWTVSDPIHVLDNNGNGILDRGDQIRILMGEGGAGARNWIRIEVKGKFAGGIYAEPS